MTHDFLMQTLNVMVLVVVLGPWVVVVACICALRRQGTHHVRHMLRASYIVHRASCTSKLEPIPLVHKYLRTRVLGIVECRSFTRKNAAEKMVCIIRRSNIQLPNIVGKEKGAAITGKRETDAQQRVACRRTECRTEGERKEKGVERRLVEEAGGGACLGPEHGRRPKTCALTLDFMLATRKGRPEPMKRRVLGCKSRVDDWVLILGTCVLGLGVHVREMQSVTLERCKYVIGLDVILRETCWVEMWRCGDGEM
ncbi:hypothetical protein BDN71DRAFT_425154 [Pleurotus eryngii]|uniref:Uncharacterized protein n=1 Tax=Pleurotus eryngii TaxID=5323 RepID=A0A9P5ZLB2_PLEER|nr:hypothetical protein BDN71DRAFT_425154 [Pleurotus eryngii]